MRLLGPALMASLTLTAVTASGCGLAPAVEARGSAAVAATAQRAGPQRLQVQVVQTYPHDPGAFTQGLVLAGDAAVREHRARGPLESARSRR